ncbi:hypothetical protein H257_12960 [Aphanomyces astaci]|uniref:Uncharacterized protein n=1 Tax=Aphanomyces astaci TaxID=112090 RepID=W4FWA1_APHAT|nr:hypothetical protein H257_12960 [Aphanomyces astaci]ETV71815.1 hypothetical protein H257_12960 [Aphanomyces astaci]|eukprot:XP_009838664.1 hypothetical protein H257_12960 [Aphanomyces astaci]
MSLGLVGCRSTRTQSRPTASTARRWNHRLSKTTPNSLRRYSRPMGVVAIYMLLLLEEGEAALIPWTTRMERRWGAAGAECAYGSEKRVRPKTKAHRTMPAAGAANFDLLKDWTFWSEVDVEVVTRVRRKCNCSVSDLMVASRAASCASRSAKSAFKSLFSPARSVTWFLRRMRDLFALSRFFMSRISCLERFDVD